MQAVEKFMGSFSEKLKTFEQGRKVHHAGGLAYDVLARIEALMPPKPTRTVETGCGRSTIVFSNLVTDHTVFCLDDGEYGEDSSVQYFKQSGLTINDNVTCVFGPTQRTLSAYEHAGQYDCVLIDGPHGYPFPDLEYYHFYPWVKEGGLLVIDDIQIASIGRMADILQEDAMWHLEEVARTTAILRRTGVPTFSNEGDGWWEQGFNQRRTETDKEFFLDDGLMLPPFKERVDERRQNIMNKKSKKKSFFKRIFK